MHKNIHITMNYERNLLQKLWYKLKTLELHALDIGISHLRREGVSEGVPKLSGVELE